MSMLNNLMVLFEAMKMENKKGNVDKFKAIVIGIILVIVGLVIAVSMLADSEIASSLFPNWSALGYPAWLVVALPFVIGLALLLVVFAFLDFKFKGR